MSVFARNLKKKNVFRVLTLIMLRNIFCSGRIKFHIWASFQVLDVRWWGKIRLKVYLAWKWLMQRTLVNSIIILYYILYILVSPPWLYILSQHVGMNDKRNWSNYHFISYSFIHKLEKYSSLEAQPSTAQASAWNTQPSNAHSLNEVSSVTSLPPTSPPSQFSMMSASTVNVVNESFRNYKELCCQQELLCGNCRKYDIENQTTEDREWFEIVVF